MGYSGITGMATPMTRYAMKTPAMIGISAGVDPAWSSMLLIAPCA